MSDEDDAAEINVETDGVDRIAQELESGNVFLNAYGYQSEIPFGGYKLSGIGREHGPRLGSNVNFDVTVGTRIPRNVHVVVLPEEIVRIVPEYRGYEYFLVGDEIVIVDPRTLEIVAIISA